MKLGAAAVPRGVLRELLVVALAVAGVADEARAGVTLVADGTARAVIVAGRDATTAERHAAHELHDGIARLTGVRVPIVEHAPAGTTTARVFVGATREARRHVPARAWRALGPDGTLIFTVGRDLVVAGDRPRGTLYAVVDLLEQLGMRWYTPSVSVVPRLTEAVVAEQAAVYTPPFGYREVTERSAAEEAAAPFLTRLRLNGHYHPIPDELGGHLTVPGYVHTFDELVPAHQHLAAHPEWFSLVDGQRVGGSGQGQLCLTNDALKAELTRALLAVIDANPGAAYYSVSPNDGGAPCGCERCRAAAAALGNHGDVLLAFVNDVAAAVERARPSVLIETLAYRTYAEPPRTVRARSNVLLRFSTIDADFARPLSAPANTAVREQLLAWRAAAPRMHVWDYDAGFGNLHVPFPATHVLAPNLRWYRDLGVGGVHVQGDLTNASVALRELKLWLTAQLLWRPDRDPAALTREFLHAVYGPAGPHLARYVDLLTEAAVAAPLPLRWTARRAGWADAAWFRRAFAAFDDAEGAVGDDPALRDRVQVQRLAVEMAWAQAPLEVRRAVIEAGGAPRPFSARAYAERARASGNPFVRERLELDERALHRALVGDGDLARLAVPTLALPRPHGSWRDLRVERAELAGGSAVLANDPEAIGGRAVLVSGPAGVWAVQFALGPFDVDGMARAEVVVRMRCDGCAAAEPVVAVATFGEELRAFGAPTLLSAPRDDGAYHEVSAGVHALSDDTTVYLAPRGPTDARRALRVDRVVLMVPREPALVP